MITADGHRLVTVAGDPHGHDAAAQRDAVRLSPYSGRSRVLRITDVRDGSAVSMIPVAGAVMAVSPDGTLAAMLVDDEDADQPLDGPAQTGHGTVTVVSTKDGTERLRVRARTLAGAVGFDPAGEWVALLVEQSLVFHAGSDGRQLRCVAFSFDPQDIAVGPGGSQVAVRGIARSRANTMAVVDAARASVLVTYDIDGWGSRPVFSPDGRRIAVLRDKAAHVLDLATGTRLCAIEHGDGTVFRVVFAGADGRHLLTADRRSLRVSMIDTEDLLRVARTRLARDLTPAERQRYLLGAAAVAP
jgi:hypothetical protein